MGTRLVTPQFASVQIGPAMNERVVTALHFLPAVYRQTERVANSGLPERRDDAIGCDTIIGT
jgi:hypothetical protein